MKGFSCHEEGLKFLQLGSSCLFLLNLLLGTLLLLMHFRIVDFMLGGIFFHEFLSSGAKEEQHSEGK